MSTQQPICSQVRILDLTPDHPVYWASAARISTTEGNALEIYEKSAASTEEQNNRLIERVFRAGHQSVLEHKSVTLAFTNVSALVEQFLIEFRLASFTVKSRRYVDFSGMGYYVPPELDGQVRTQYIRQMDRLFAVYEQFLAQGIPKEDARFLLPSCFFSNLYCTVNLRELLHMLDEMRTGRGSQFPELQGLADQIADQLKTCCPFLLLPPRPPVDQPPTDQPQKAVVLPQARVAKVSLIQQPIQPEALLRHIQRLSGEADSPLEDLLYDSRPRLLEHLTYTFLIEHLSLSGLTHLVRHRLQSIQIPALDTLDGSGYLLPPSIASRPPLSQQYQACFIDTQALVEQLRDAGVPASLRAYCRLSGTVLSCVTTMNVRELMHFFSLRCCSRAQWEIRDVAEQMRTLACESLPLFRRMGPGCVRNGVCPEGPLSCGHPKSLAEPYCSTHAKER
ncbi:MAG: FAD-dependent thymidylate synthase [Oscillospiraceae bacterium]|nr:FAD-dependent thymidylate synthase [Oscillospiraceae bacterium]